MDFRYEKHLTSSKVWHRASTMLRVVLVGIRRVGCLAMAIYLASACSQHSNSSGRLAPNGVPLAPNITCATTDCRSYNAQPYILIQSKFGIGCLGNVPPGSTPNPAPPPESYRVKDNGQPGFPALKPAESALTRRVVRYTKSDTLRIAWVSQRRADAEFIVFDAIYGPCYNGAGGYPVLNGMCNEFYEPGETPYHTLHSPDCFPSKRPWL